MNTEAPVWHMFLVDIEGLNTRRHKSTSGVMSHVVIPEPSYNREIEAVRTAYVSIRH